jgi:two-component system, NtrC family, C4-dicarboxylate transport sensor histidine kinase DctB
MSLQRALMSRRTIALVIGAAVLIGAGVLSYLFAERAALRNLGSAAQDRLSLLERTLDYTVGRFSYLPDVLSQATPIIEAYRNPSDPKAIRDANRYLKSLNETAGSAELYIVDRNGIALAASNFDRETTFVGQNYAFRPYFTDALTKGEGRYYAIGVTTGQPGYFLWHAVPDAEGNTIGVAVVKIDLLHLQSDWKSVDDVVAMVDENKVIFLTSHPEWQYRPMTPLTTSQLQMFRETQQYGGAVLRASPLLSGEREIDGIPVENVDDGSVTGHEYVAFSRTLAQYGWSLIVLSDMREVQAQAGLAAGGAVLTVVAGFLILLVTYQRRQMARAKLTAHTMLEHRVAVRTAELTAANTQLSVEIDQRIRIEQNLRRAQDNLIHATKMASLGQALAGVAHEINQSLAALRTYIASTQVFVARSDKERVVTNLTTVSSIVERMGELTQHLKSFARKETVAKQSTDLAAAVRYGLKLIDYRITADDVQLTVILPDHPVYIVGNTIRLEQVVVNLVSNALDAMREHSHRHLTVELFDDKGAAVLEVTDTGRGIARDMLSSVFDPFYTTKEVGEGLGLGLSISYGIIKDMAGDITVESELNVGTTFRITLPLAAEVASPAEINA